MKDVVYVDSDGYIRRATLKDSDPESIADCGIPAGPPDLRHVDIDAFLKDINNLLAEQELFTWDDVQRRTGGLTPALNTFKRLLVSLYRQESNKNQKPKL